MGSGADSKQFDVDYPPLDVMQTTTLPPYPCTCTYDEFDVCKHGESVPGNVSCSKAAVNLAKRLI